MPSTLTRTEYNQIRGKTREAIFKLLRDLMEECGYDQGDIEEAFIKGLLAALKDSLKVKNDDARLLFAADLLARRPMAYRYEEPKS